MFAVVVVGLGTTALMVGGDQQPPSPKVTPAVDVFMVQQSIVTGDLPVTQSATGVPTPANAVP
jgi:hypothetical protein